MAIPNRNRPEQRQTSKTPTILREHSLENELYQFEQELTQVNPKVFEGVPIPKKNAILKTLVSFTVKHHSGPLPDPETLTQYNTVIPNGADRIMTMAETQQMHRMKLESKAVSSQLNQSLLGQIFGFTIAVFVVVVGAYLALNGCQVTGGLLVSGALVALVSIFVLGKNVKQKTA